MKTKHDIIYAVYSGFYSDHGQSDGFDSFYTTKRNALKKIQSEIKLIGRCIKRKRNEWDLGDYFLRLVEVHLDSPIWHCSREEAFNNEEKG